MSRFGVLIGLCASPMLLLQPGLADAQTCAVEQLTVTVAGDSREPSLSGDGSALAFRSSSDFTGSNLDGNTEVFVYEFSPDSFQQLTTSSGGANISPSLSSDGNWVAFLSNSDLTSNNADGNRELFWAKRVPLVISQITTTIGGDNANSSLSGDGTRIAFLSDRDLTGGNPDVNTEVFFYDTGTRVFTQLTSTTTGFTSDARISRDGNWIVFVSNQDLTGSNADLSQELFLSNALGTNLTQITNTLTGFSNDPAVNADGTLIAFSSTSDLTGGNADGNQELFIFHADGAFFEQVTDTSGVGQINSAAISDAGRRVTFRTSYGHGIGNVDGGLDIALFDTTSGDLSFVTNNPTSSAVANPTIDASGSRIAFRTTADLVGQNADGNFEIFVAECVLPVPLLHGPGLTAAAVALLLCMLALDRRRLLSGR